jgi:hypothetical protein
MRNVNTVEITPALEREFWSRIAGDGVENCWQWIGFEGCAYPTFHNYGAHRLGWRIVFGGHIPEHLYVCHQCDHPWCMNPSHWFLGTNLQNIRDALAKKRMWWQQKQRLG